MFTITTESQSRISPVGLHGVFTIWPVNEHPAERGTVSERLPESLAIGTVMLAELQCRPPSLTLRESRRMRSMLRSAFAIVALGLVSFAAAAETEEGFTRLDNGKNFDGWKISESPE